MTQDILILLLPYLSSTDASALFEMCLSGDILGSKDNGVQKRGYKILAKLAESGKVDVNPEEVLGKLDELAEGLSSAAKKDRCTLLALLIPMLPSGAMHVIPSLIPEAVLGTKEPSEKARSAAFDLIVAMGHKMAEGGVVKRNMMEGMDDEEGSGEGTKCLLKQSSQLIFTFRAAVASAEEYMTMVAGGLAGATPHMISATITALSRLVFEFKGGKIPTVLSAKLIGVYRHHFLRYAKRDLHNPSCLPDVCQPRDCQVHFRIHQTCHTYSARGYSPPSPQSPRTSAPSVVARPQEPLQGKSTPYL